MNSPSQSAVMEHARGIDARLHSQLRKPVLLPIFISTSSLLTYLAIRFSWTGEIPATWVLASCIGICLSFAGAFLAFRIGGPFSSIYEWADGIECVVFGAANLLFICQVRSMHNIGWLFHFLFVLHASQSPIQRPLYVATYIGVPFLACIRYVYLGDWALASACAVLGGLVWILHQTLKRTALETAENLARRVVLEEQVRLLGLKSERERIARDLHDGVSAELHAMMWLSESGAENQMSERLRATALQLRDVVWGLSLAEKPFEEWLADLKMRCTELCGNELVLKFESRLSQVIQLSPIKQHALTRIVLEATRNASKHSKGNDLHLKFENIGPFIVFEAADNGQGFQPATTQHNRGLSNMKIRAQELGGTYEVSDAQPGTRVRIQIPIGFEQ
jgi:signal transduction histidine kinase